MSVRASAAAFAIIAMALTWVVYWNPRTVADGDEEPVVTSVWCQGANRDERRCRFENLCYLPSLKRFMFSAGPTSVVAGINKTAFFQELVDTNSMSDHNVLVLNMGVIDAGMSTKFPIRVYPHKILAVHRFKPDHIMHTLHDEVLPIFHTYDDLCQGNISHCASQYQLFFVDGNALGALIDLYRPFSAREPFEIKTLAELNPDALVCFSEVLVGLSKIPVWYNYGFGMDQTALPARTHGANMRRFTDYLIGKIPPAPEKSNICNNATVFLERLGTRKILNGDEVFSALKKHTTEHPIVRTSYESLDWLGLLHCFRQARAVVGMHGAALILELFMKPGSGLLELYPYGVSAQDVTPYSSLANMQGMDLFYASWENHNRSNTIFYPENSAFLGGIRHLPVEEQQRLEALTSVKPGQCCYRSEWIYFMYQDTHVNVTELEPIYVDLLTTMRSYTPSLDPITRSIVYPLNVENPTCILSKTDIRIEWEEPWNIAYMSNRLEVKYNVLIEYLGDYNTTKTRLRLEVFEDEYEIMVSSGRVLVWLLCYHGDYKGLDKTIYCQW